VTAVRLASPLGRSIAIDFRIRDLDGQCSLTTWRWTIAQVKLNGQINGQSWNEVNPMAVRQPRYSKEEFAQCGDALYESEIRSQVEEGNHGKIVAIDIDIY
jgi:hypothetical protein